MDTPTQWELLSFHTLMHTFTPSLTHTQTLERDRGEGERGRESERERGKEGGRDRGRERGRERERKKEREKDACGSWYIKAVFIIQCILYT